MNTKVIAFDADDTLWINETYYKEAENKFCKLLRNYLSEKEAYQELFNTEMKNISLFGYGAKGFTISMIETALSISNNEISSAAIQEIISYGKKLMDYPMVILPGVEHVLDSLKDKYRLIIVTKGDLMDQERKLKKSGLTGYFHHIEILSNKKESNYLKLLEKLEIEPDDFLMIGNSLRSDIVPVLKIGAYAFHIPFHESWVHESEIEEEIVSDRFFEIENIMGVPDLIEKHYI
jgi:putative hydrolase of the HAD superfamily